jgi:hypothetical protein
MFNSYSSTLSFDVVLQKSFQNTCEYICAAVFCQYIRAWVWIGITSDSDEDG